MINSIIHLLNSALSPNNASGSKADGIAFGRLTILNRLKKHSSGEAIELLASHYLLFEIGNIVNQYLPVCQEYRETVHEYVSKGMAETQQTNVSNDLENDRRAIDRIYLDLKGLNALIDLASQYVSSQVANNFAEQYSLDLYHFVLMNHKWWKPWQMEQKTLENFAFLSGELYAYEEVKSVLIEIITGTKLPSDLNQYLTNEVFQYLVDLGLEDKQRELAESLILDYQWLTQLKSKTKSSIYQQIQSAMDNRVSLLTNTPLPVI
jgi:hypothetical protein